MKVTPYLHFDGRCEEAIEFYCQKLDAKVQILMHYKDNPELPSPGMIPSGIADKVMHASFCIGESRVMASDDCSGRETNLQGFHLTLTVANDLEAEQRFAALADGGQVKMPLSKSFFSSNFGMLIDRFGVSWIVIVDH